MSPMSSIAMTTKLMTNGNMAGQYIPIGKVLTLHTQQETAEILL